MATPQGAQALVRTLIQAGLTEPVDVVFAAGTYDLDAPLELRPEDSGTAAFPDHLEGGDQRRPWS